MLNTSVRMSYITDTGASISVVGMGFARQLGVSEDDLLQTSMAVTSVENSSIKVLGVVVVELQYEGVNTNELICICRGAKGCMLSLDVCAGGVPCDRIGVLSEGVEGEHVERKEDEGGGDNNESQ